MVVSGLWVRWSIRVADPRTLFKLPIFDFWRGFERSLDTGTRGLLLVFLGLFLMWWIYVPVHEFLHALACLALGGTVTRLEIAPLYGGAWFAKHFDFVVAESEYAGRLAGFDTGGSDIVYAFTVFGPYFLTLLPGVLLLRAAGRRGNALAFGASLPLALVPFLSLPGDAYEMGSILTTRIPPWTSHAELLRGDDVVLRAQALLEVAQAPWVGFVVSFLMGALWAFLTYGVGGWIASRLGEKPL